MMKQRSLLTNNVSSCVFAALLFIVPSGLSAAIRGHVTLDGGSSPAAGLVIRVENPTKTVVTRTDANGRFSAEEFGAERVLISVLQEGRLVYRDIKLVQPGTEVKIDLRTASAPELPAKFDPIALAVLPAGVFVASDGNQLHKFTKDSFAGTVARGLELNDLAALPSAGLLVGCTKDSSSRIGFVVGIDPSSGKVVKKWSIGTSLCSGLAGDPETGTIYISRTQDRSIWKVDANSGSTSLLAHIPKFPGSGDMPGPICVDPRQKRLFIGAGERIVAVDLATRRSRVFADRLGDIRALAIDSAGHRLYATDPDKYRVWQFDLQAAKPVAADFAGKKNIKSAHAIGVDASGTIWIGDREDNAVLAFAPDGSLKARQSRK